MIDNVLNAIREIDMYKKDGFDLVKCSGIHGWTSAEDLIWLYCMARHMNSILEIGSWQGKSTYALLSGCKGMVTAVDHFEGSEGERDTWHAAVKTEDIHKNFMDNVGHFKNLKVIKMDSELAAKELESEKFDMVFIDGDHAKKIVLKDIATWMPKTNRIICGHDIDHDTVKEAVEESIGDYKTTKGNIWYKEKR